ncbi:ABC transporter substrate-binding protein [Allomesorhizobium alhagi]|jgi:ABC-type transport system substrate-binding protein|uniref:Extracellular solute-binding protein n=1 Tax=Mesorhizobium alhagi CCNWXJ12-2 TaxID=1107882 RepID=H0HJD8_9HYPH|nr:ABC transporter substrate-binding protein [Mesorhizobium alhagi]EHK59184.1 extracellular solute-binding protein [Mesorhizobium alhagi CCNWXJ12-2]
MKKLLLSSAAIAVLALALPAPAFSQEIKQGGSMTVTYKDDVSTLDPAIGYDWQNWSMIKSLFDGLMDYEPGTTTLKPDLAESYEISPDGQTFTFKLRQGVKFHNGRELTAEDVKYSIERVVNPATQSPGAGFFGSIKGFEEASAGKADSLSGITVVDPYTIEFELSRPDATFLHVAAINFAHVVPKEEVEKHGADFGKHPVGSGAFKLAEWTLGQKLVFERFADYWNKGLPKLDQITFEVGQEPIVALLRLQKGEIDIPGDGIPPAKFIEVKEDPAFKDLVIQGGQLHTGYVAMNVKIKPFDDVKVRQAVNMAVNKDRIVRIINGRAIPANQPLPPTMPGYAKDYEGYPYDVEKAKALMAEAGLADGVETELFVMNTDPQPRIAQAIQQDLAAIGIKASVKSLAQANVIAAGGEPDGAPMIWSGGMAWIADFPDPSNFYGPILGCGGAVQGGWNWSWYCNEELDSQAAAADAIVDPARKAEREETWRNIYLKIMEDAPWAPIFNEERFSVRSARIGGADELFVDPVHIPVHYDQVYAKDVQ